ncbi:LEAF RUST 10 DISEASE-RESISTANCE LOCUS RECEPTOR-LIKE PROTEIN KINASE-like 1.4 [Impatiens glandulifera]|uniref:LEAF RUST 10 DISEASE-RESISTANCE LOCUS RECEPTOR-LIKE PROTEIN KINASE-like 1.4 n=1 Tax=Impatiens glandulifera TaxID=253017 RepID=UPI001FB172CD|nr:LEAF RUST 10 DISEASE-RESISTANCE LOCUS RECEPTOR-LIKE PROTEIN KINASE-like 1.4 [Impatiens glandulifera]
MLVSPPLTAAVAAAAAIIISLLLPSSSSSSSTFPNCNKSFSCGTLKNITYPFTGGDRPIHCGPPEFHLNCRKNQTELTTSNSFTHRVHTINQIQQTLILSRSDLYNKTCPNKFQNYTLNTTLFNTQFENQNLSLIYGCSSLLNNYTPSNLFTCNLSGIKNTNAFYLVGIVPTDPILQTFIQCIVTLTVAVMWDTAVRLVENRISLREALMEGFNVNYTDSYGEMCNRCRNFGGLCGFDHNFGRSICICDDKLCSVPDFDHAKASDSSNHGLGHKAKTDLYIAGAILTGIVVGWFIFSCRQRWKRKAIGLQDKNKDLLQLSHGTNTSPPLSNLSKIVTSFSSSKTDFGESNYFGTRIFSYEELERATQSFDPSSELGKGGFGIVYRGILEDGRVVAVKRLYENNFKSVEQFMNEVEILTRLRHHNLVTLYGCTSKTSRGLLLVYEFISNGTLADHLHGKRANSGLLTWSVRLKIAYETARALAYLHESETIHRDVKTNNILLDNEFHVKVADFGLSRLLPTDVTHVSTAPQGTPGYVDPEYYQCYRLTEKSDVYSFGVVLIELVSSKQAVDTNRNRYDINLANMAINKIQNHALEDLFDPYLGFDTNESVRRRMVLATQLAFRCLQHEGDMRPSMGEVLKELELIKKEKLDDDTKTKVVDIIIDEGDASPLRGNPPPMSSDSNSSA